MESQQLLRLLDAPHCWDLVMSHLKSYNDCRNAANATELFQNILTIDQHPKWTNLLFDTTFHVLFNHLSASDMLKLRLVSESFKDSVDNYLKHGSTFSTKDPSWETRPKLELGKYLDITQQHIFNYNTIVNAAPTTKIIGGAVSVDFTNHTGNCTHFMGKFGNQIVHLTLCFQRSYPGNGRNILDVIRKILKKTPNLKTLCVRIDHLENTLANGDQSVEQFRSFLEAEENGFPELRALLYFQLDLGRIFLSGNRVPPFAVLIENVLMNAYSKQVNSLKLCHREDFILPESALPMLKNLQIELWSVVDFEKLKSLKAPVETLKIHWQCWHRHFDFASVEFFEGLQVFTNLTTLIIDNCTLEYAPIDKLVKTAKVPQSVKHVELLEFMGSTGATFPFVENFKKLQFLKITFIYPRLITVSEDDGDNQLYLDHLPTTEHLFCDWRLPTYVDFYMNEIWEVLPELQEVQVESMEKSRTFHRNAYTSFQSMLAKMSLFHDGILLWENE